ncbi:MAG: hypothetical protein NW703_08505 [Nitrospiraceae bacterium]
MKAPILNVAFLTMGCAILTACHPDRPIPQPIMTLDRTEVESVGADDPKQDLQAHRQRVNRESPLTIRPSRLPLVGRTGSSVGMMALGTIATRHRVWPSPQLRIEKPFTGASRGAVSDSTLGVT